MGTSGSERLPRIAARLTRRRLGGFPLGPKAAALLREARNEFEHAEDDPHMTPSDVMDFAEAVHKEATDRLAHINSGPRRGILPHHFASSGAGSTPVQRHFRAVERILDDAADDDSVSILDYGEILRDVIKTAAAWHGATLHRNPNPQRHPLR